MTWWRRNQDAVIEKQRQADRAVKLADAQLQQVQDLKPIVDERVATLRRLNRENNWAVRVDLAYQGRA